MIHIALYHSEETYPCLETLPAHSLYSCTINKYPFRVLDSHSDIWSNFRN